MLCSVGWEGESNEAGGRGLESEPDNESEEIKERVGE